MEIEIVVLVFIWPRSYQK